MKLETFSPCTCTEEGNRLHISVDLTLLSLLWTTEIKEQAFYCTHKLVKKLKQWILFSSASSLIVEDLTVRRGSQWSCGVYC